jgi:hypothetical protein
VQNPNPREPPEELIKIRAKEAEKLREHWAKASDKDLKETIDLSLFNYEHNN